MAYQCNLAMFVVSDVAD